MNPIRSESTSVEQTHRMLACSFFPILERTEYRVVLYVQLTSPFFCFFSFYLDQQSLCGPIYAATTMIRMQDELASMTAVDVLMTHWRRRKGFPAYSGQTCMLSYVCLFCVLHRAFSLGGLRFFAP